MNCINKSQRVSSSRETAELSTLLAESHLSFHWGTETLHSAYEVLSFIVAKRTDRSSIEKSKLLNSLSDFQENRKDWPSWVLKIAQNKALSSQTTAHHPIGLNDGLMFIYACHSMAIGISLHFFYGKKLTCLLFEEGNTESYEILFHKDRYYFLKTKRLDCKEGKYSQSQNRYSCLNSLQGSCRTLDQVGKTSRQNNYYSRLAQANKDSETHGNSTSGKRGREEPRHHQKQQMNKYDCRKPQTEKYSSYVNYKQLSNTLADQGEAYQSKRPADVERQKIKVKQDESNDCVLETSAQKDLKGYEDQNACVMSPGPLSDTSDEFAKALNYITTYQERLHKINKSRANGKVCELQAEGVSKKIFEGSLKFYAEKAKFGFIKIDNHNEVFLHKDNLVKSRIDPAMLETCAKYFDIILKFQTLAYKGASNSRVKAVNIEIVNFVPKIIEDK